MNSNLLKGFMVMNGDTQKDLAGALGIDQNTVGKKLNQVGNSEFTLSELYRIVKRYNLTADDVNRIFFN